MHILKPLFIHYIQNQPGILTVFSTKEIKNGHYSSEITERFGVEYKLLGRKADTTITMSIP